jgi:hypothetical protein
MDTAASSRDDLSPPVGRSIGALVAERRMSWRETLDNSVLATAALLGAAAVVLTARGLRRH